MKKSLIFFTYSSFLSGCGFCIFLILGSLKIISILPAIIGSILFLTGLEAIINDKRYWQVKNRLDLNSKIRNKDNNILSSINIFQLINTLLEKLPLKKFSPGQTLLIFATMLIFLFILSIMFIQSIYNITVFTDQDLRLAALVNIIVIFIYILIYGLGEILGVKLFKKKKGC
ncbi:MAG: hypothetical protein PWQ67_877 [Clostridia bacterium]|jgi:hypothetical protein|nr:hypothetical protein [Clostridia bacterium]MDN5322423.1 hypothetical protein [Clostridia bacterium]